MKLLCACLLLASSFYSSAADTAPDISEKAFDAGVALRKAGKDAEAEKAMQALVAARTQALGAEARETLLARLELLKIESPQRKDTAVAAALTLLPILQRVLGAEDRQTLNCRTVLVYARSKQGKYAEAEPECRSLIADLTRVLGPEDPQTLAELKVLTSILYNQTKYAEAEPECRSLIADLKRVLGPKDRQTLAERAKLTRILYNQNKYAEAEPECRSLIADMTRTLGPKHAQTLTERSELVSILAYQEKYTEAKQECRSLVADMSRALGPEHHETLAGRAILADILLYQKKYAEAVQEQRAILTIRERALGAGEKATLTTYQDLAICLQALGQPQEALPYAQRALAGRLKLLGPDAADTDASQRLVNQLTHTAAPAPGTTQPQETDPPVVMVDGALIRASALKAVLHTLPPPPLPSVPNPHAAQELAELDPQSLLSHYASGKHSHANLRPQFPELLRSSSFIEANPQPVESDQSASKRKALDKLIDEQLLLNEWRRNGYSLQAKYVDEDINQLIQDKFKGSRADFLADLAQKSVSEKDFRAERERKFILNLMRAHLMGEVKITPQEAREYYTKHKDRWAGDAEVKIHTLSIPQTFGKTEDETRRTAQGLRTRILEGADFAATARKESQDSHAEDGGAWDWTTISDLSAPVSDAIQQTQTGQISALIEQGSTFIILRVDDYRAPATPPFEKVQEDISQLLEKEKRQERLDAQMAQLRSTANIQLLAPAEK